MPIEQDKSKIIVSIFKLTIDGNDFPHHLNMRVMLGFNETPVHSHAVGTTPLGYRITGHAVEVTLDAQQLGTSFDAFLDLTDGAPPAVGAERTEHALVIHPVSMGADDSQDIIVPKAVFGPTIDSSKDPSRNDMGTVTIRGVHNPAGPVWRIGPEPV